MVHYLLGTARQDIEDGVMYLRAVEIIGDTL